MSAHLKRYDEGIKQLIDKNNISNMTYNEID